MASPFSEFPGGLSQRWNRYPLHLTVMEGQFDGFSRLHFQNIPETDWADEQNRMSQRPLEPRAFQTNTINMTMHRPANTNALIDEGCSQPLIATTHTAAAQTIRVDIDKITEPLVKVQSPQPHG